MMEQQKWDYLVSLHDEFHLGGTILSEWTVFIIRDAETAFCCGADLSAILAALAAVESHLRYEYFSNQNTKGWGLSKLIDRAALPLGLSDELHSLRRLRNKWVHVENPTEDDHLLEKPEYHEAELRKAAGLAMQSMIRVLYLEQCV